MADQQFFLKWNDFQTNMVTSFRHLRDEKSFTDVNEISYYTHVGMSSPLAIFCWIWLVSGLFYMERCWAMWNLQSTMHFITFHFWRFQFGRVPSVFITYLVVQYVHNLDIFHVTFCSEISILSILVPHSLKTTIYSINLIFFSFFPGNIGMWRTNLQSTQNGFIGMQSLF